MLWVRFLNDDFQTSFFILFSSFWLVFFCIATSLVEVGAWDVQGLPPMAQPAPRQSYASMAGKPAPSCHKPPRQWNQAPVTLIYQWKGGGGRDGGKRMIQRLNEESGRQENAVLSTGRWCKQGRPLLSQTTDRWPRPLSLLLTVLNKYFI